MLKEIITSSFNYLLGLMFIIFSFYLIQELTDNKFIILSLVLSLGVIGYIVGSTLSNKSIKVKIITLLVTFVLYILLLFVNFYSNQSKNKFQQLIGEWKTNNKNDVNFILEIDKNGLASIGMSPKYNKKEFKVIFSDNCLHFSENKDLDNFEWCITLVQNDIFYIEENLDTIYFFRKKN